MPVWFLWLCPVLVAPVLAGLWVAWSGRRRRPLPIRDTVQEHERFRAALGQPLSLSVVQRSGR